MPILTTSDLGTAIRARRRALHMTQEELALAVGVNRRVIGELERGKPTVRTEIALATAVGLGLDIELLERGGPRRA